MTIGAGIAIAAIWVATAGTLIRFREDVSALSVLIALGIAAWTTAFVTGAH